ncbi:MAG: RNA polymerase sigma factor [Bacteroidia bacterium]|nr:RNA polymerase sigma factor [Bacteroidia bacterium]MCC6767487.1 RNA polymerase sigma factor [Bacteroidia bacterium]
MEELSDRYLLELFARPATREKAFTLLVQQYQRPMYFHIRRMVNSHDDADDLLQNTFLKAYRALDRFRGDARLFTWLYRIATNECLSFLSQKKKHYFIAADQNAGHDQVHADASPLVNADLVEMRLWQAMQTLPAKQRLVFSMKYFEGLKYEEISEVLGTSVGALKASYHLAVKKIEEFIRHH